MATYFTRKLMGAIVTVFAVAFILHTISWIIPGDQHDVVREICCPRGEPYIYSYTYMVAELHLDKPFPLGYFLWLFDPSGRIAYEPRGPLRRLPPDLDLTLLGYHLTGSGLLTGDFGVSTFVAKGQPAFAFSVADLLDLFARLLLPGIALATLQRVGHRPHSHKPYRPAIPMRAYLLAVQNIHL